MRVAIAPLPYHNKKEIAIANNTKDFQKYIEGEIRTFETGATRDTDANKLDYEGFLSPLVLERYAQYMNKNRIQANGELRDSDNWTKGIPRRAYLKSLWRHFMDVWCLMRGYTDKSTVPDIQEALCAVIFNAMGLLHEVLLNRGEDTTAKT